MPDDTPKLQTSGAISLRDVNVLVNANASNSIDMNGGVFRAVTRRPNRNTTISMSDAYGKSPVTEVTIGLADTILEQSINLRQEYVLATGDATESVKWVVFNFVGSVVGTSPDIPAMTTGLWPDGCTLTLNIPALSSDYSNGFIGGRGGTGGYASCHPQRKGGANPCGTEDGQAGGCAFEALYPITINNAGVIAGGGGGGGALIRNNGGFAITCGGGGAPLGQPGCWDSSIAYGSCGYKPTASGIRNGGGGSGTSDHICQIYFSGGGGSWNEYGGNAAPNFRAYGRGGPPGKAISLNGKSVTLTNTANGVTYGAIS